jgi:tetratricopeptide (TPR) repeat protein
MKKILSIFLGITLFAACDLGDPFEVVNPNLDETIIGTPNSSAAWLEGTDRQMALSTNYWVVISEIASDNYVNTNTFYNQFMDDLVFDFTDTDLNLVHRGVARLREMALFGLNEVGPADVGYTEVQRSEFLYYAGISHIFTADMFQAAPATTGGPALSRDQHASAAVTYFEQAIMANPDNFAAYLGLARAYYRLGDKTQATNAANQVLTLDPMLLKNINFDPANSTGNRGGFNYTTNDLQLALYDRGGFDDLQPLPRLDFLDPKLYAISATVSSPIALAKAEEAHLIIAEAQLSDSDVGAARQTLKNLIALIAQRPTGTFDDSQEDRTQRNPGTRPDTSAVIVDGVEGLVLDRKDGPVTVPIVSGTSITDEILDAITDENEMLATLYLMRQEIFIAEGRRFSDMGLTYPMSENEIQQNSNIDASLSLADIPPFLDAVRTEIDAIDYNTETFVVTTIINVNQLIVENRTSQYVCPFH